MITKYRLMNYRPSFMAMAFYAATSVIFVSRIHGKTILPKKNFSKERVSPDEIEEAIRHYPRPLSSYI